MAAGPARGPRGDRRGLEGPLAVAGLALRFRVSDDDERVELDAYHGQRRIDLDMRVHHRPLLLLARARLEDRERPAKDQGWVEQARLCQSLACDSKRPYVDIHRVRRQLAAAGVADAAKIVERRSKIGLLRIGTPRLDVVTARAGRRSGGARRPT